MTMCCDGSCKQDAETGTGKLGIGVVVRGWHGRTVWKVSEKAGRGNSTQAEYKAIIRALHILHCLRVPRARIYSDSQTVVDYLTQIFEPRSDILKPLHDEALTLLPGFEYLDIQYLPREENKDADKLAKAALSLN